MELTPSWTAHSLARPPRLRHACSDPFPQHLSLEFGDCPQNLKRQPSSGKGSVHILLERDQIHAQRSAFLGDAQQLFQ
jgi:hypothetical protein